MERRAVLATLGSGASLLTAGCLSVVVATPEPVDLELWNETANAHEVEVTIRDESDDAVLDRTYSIEAASEGPPGGNVIREEAFTEATDGTRFDAAVTLDRRTTWEHRFEVTCNDSDPESVFVVEITSGRESSVTFSQSTCS